ncbi:MAG: hypothetical protein IIA45_11760 [Bacteroidetes bacterium]|nr:hypothetical protein [Bacteroidota bacterium]
MDKKLCYQIVIQYDKGQILYRDFTEYEDYRTYHNRFIEAINNKDLVVANFYISDSSETTLAAV